MEIRPVAVPRRRRYRMVARAQATAATRASIGEASLELLRRFDYDEVTLDQVAERAGVTVQTVLRHYTSKSELFTAVAHDVAQEEARARRDHVPPGDIDAALKVLVGRYERLGDLMLRLVAQEDRFPAVRAATDTGRDVHYRWVEEVFARFLTGLSRAERNRRRGQVIVLTDLFTWRLLRRDLGMGRVQTQAAMAEMLHALLEGRS